MASPRQRCSQTSGEVGDLLPALQLLCAAKKLDREKGEDQFRSLALQKNDLDYLSKWIPDKLDGLSNWEDAFGGLTAATIILQSASVNQLDDLGVVPILESQALECHENVEFRVRIAAGQLMGALCQRFGLESFQHFLPHVVRGVEENLERNIDTPSTEAEYSLRELDLAKERDVDFSRSSLSIFHDTAGWKHLETWMKCLQQMVVNLKPEAFVQVERSGMFTLLFKAVQHTNRFVRETGYDVLASLIRGHGCHQYPGQEENSYKSVAEQLAIGLSDNWSQVRMAASRATRTFFEVPPPAKHTVEEVYPLLLPPMCLNRYYVAEGVRIYSQDTWCQVTKGEGKVLLGRYLNEVLKYYIIQTDADNHAVREAACASIAETASKLEADILRPHINSLLDALLVCFGDESWPVRDAACSALGTLIATFPKESKAAGHVDLMATQFKRNLADPIPSVRDGAASSIVRILSTAMDTELTQSYNEYVTEMLTELANQPADSHGAESHRVEGRGPGASHVIARRGVEAHDDRHTNQTMYSCGSLAPKLQKGRKGGGCHDGLTQRPAEPWERADGAVRLIGQLAEHNSNLLTDSLVQQMLEAASHSHYVHHPYFLETVCHVAVQLCQGLEKPRFKRHLDDLLVVLGGAVESQLPLAVVAGEETLNVFASRVGANVLRGRVSNHTDSRVVRSLLDRLPPAM